MSDEHAFLAPSSAHIWGPGGCAYYPTMAAKYPADDDTPESREGTAAHHYLSSVLAGVACAVGDLAPNGHPITEEMVDCAHDLIADVTEWHPRCAGMFLVEQRVYMPEIHPTLNWGTTDIGGVDMTNRVIYARDYKFGHRYVDAYENMQLVDYVVGIARHFRIAIDGTWTINAGIFQPRCYQEEGARKIWTVNGLRFLELADSLAYAARKTCEPEPEMRTGEYCEDCEGRMHCPALRRVGGRAIDLSLRSVPHELPVEALGLLRTHIEAASERLKALGTGMDARIEALTRAGHAVPGWGLKPSESRLNWKVPLDEVFTLGDLFGVDARKKDALTPKQLQEKAKKAGIQIDDDVISEYAERKSGKLKVAPIAGNAAAKAFR